MSQPNLGRGRSGESGAGSILSFIIAGSIFIMAVAGLIAFTSGVGGPGATSTVQDQLDAEAAAALEALLRTPGAVENLPWTDPDQADALTGLGLREDGQARIPLWKLARFNGRMEADTPGDVIDYPEVRALLGLDAPGKEFDVHIRLRPYFADMEAVASGAAPRFDLKTSVLAAPGDIVTPAMLQALVTDAPGVAFDTDADVIVVGSDNPVPLLVLEAKTFLDGGGLLVLYGGASTAVLADLEAFYPPSGLAWAAGPLLAQNDTNHPLRTAPNSLAAEAYAGRGADGASSHLEHFTVVARDAAGVPILSISKPGAYGGGGGRIILARTCASDPTSEAASCPAVPAAPPTTMCELYREGCLLLHNLLVQRFWPLFLDYGPPAVAPAGSEASGAVVCLADSCLDAESAWDVMQAAADPAIVDGIVAILSVTVFQGPPASA